MSTWVLLRGLTRDSRHWGEFTLRLQQSFPKDRILAVDLPGNGSLHSQPSPTTVSAMTESCRRQLAEQSARPPYRVLAMSLGAMVAVEWACQYPREIECSVLINTSLRGINPFYWRLRPRAYPTLLKQALGRRGPRDREKAVMRLTTRHPPRPEQVLQEWIDYGDRYPVSVRNAFRQLLAAARFRASATAPPSPVLVLASERDELVNVRCSRQLAKAWNCSIAIHPSAGHDIALDDGPWVVDSVLRWLAERAASADTGNY